LHVPVLFKYKILYNIFMRIKINLSIQGNVSIPIEYNYNIYLNLRKTLLDFLQFNKPKLFNRYKKDFPGFSFSQLMIPERKVESGFIKIQGNYLALYITSIDNNFIEYLTKSINYKKEIPIATHTFKLKKIEILEEPEFKEEMSFRMLSPLLLMKKENNKILFIRPGDSDLNEVFAAQLVDAYREVYNTEAPAESIVIIPDQDYILRKKNLTKLVTIRNIHYKTIFCPITLKGSKELIRFAYQNGIGAKTHYGFGMLEVV